jgi:excisionase family DNA binding protein
MKCGEKRKDKKTLTAQQVSRECGFGLAHTYQMLADGVIPSIRVGNRYYVPRAALERWLESCGGKVTA